MNEAWIEIERPDDFAEILARACALSATSLGRALHDAEIRMLRVAVARYLQAGPAEPATVH